MAEPFVCHVNPSLAAKIRADLEERGYDIATPQYTFFQAKKTGVSCTFYTSGKLVVQGKGMLELIEFYLEPEILQEVVFTHAATLKDSSQEMEPHIGADESGKGDLFGPLCVVSLYADREGVEKLLAMGVQESKKVTDKTAIELGGKIAAQFDHHSVVINPMKYNEMYTKIGNLNTLLAWAHATAIRNMVGKSGCQRVILDKFADERVMLKAFRGDMEGIDLIQRTKAEEDIVVAAASLIARKLFLDGLARLSKELEMTIPKGAGKEANETTRRLYAKGGLPLLEGAVKLHFKNLDPVLGRLPK